MSVPGQREFPRFQVFGAWTGQLRALRQVDFAPSETGRPLSVISDGPGIIGEELTLALVQGNEHVDVHVRVVATTPRVINERVRHQLQLEVIDAVASPDSGAAQ